MATDNTNTALELGAEDFAATIDGHPFAVILFWAPSDRASVEFAHVIDAAASRHGDLLFARVNAEQHPDIGAQFDLRALPTLMILRENIIVGAKAGALQPGALDELLAAVRRLDMDEVRRNVVSVDEVAVSSGPSTSADGAVGIDATDDVASLEPYLHPALRDQPALWEQVHARLAAGGLVALRNAFDPAFAERMHRCLDQCSAWRVYEGYEEVFHFHHHNLYELDAFPPELLECSQLFGSARTKDWVARISGRQCDGPTEFSASWYLPGDHSLPHNDVADIDGQVQRQVAYVWHLAKDWRPEWGGALYWCDKGLYLPPEFNTLWLFNVGPASNHFVTHVSPYAQGKRLAINGWWTGPNPTGEPGGSAPTRIALKDAEVVFY